ncbi:MAG: prepilin-type N-terminal cleavage/methylation domain-containing protein [Deltaproteobacteria bacterium]|nr:prepilin-type N-terminal cleavage/methylation domain-containing protein [Deltaproteobacteria bacterium]
MKRHSQRGFSLLELMIVVIITGVVTAVTIPWFAGVQRQNQVGTVTRKVIGYLNSARVYSATGRQFLDAASLPVRTNQSTLRFTCAGTCPSGATNRFELLVSDGTNQLSLDVVDLDTLNPGNQTFISVPSTPPFDVTFFVDGSSTSTVLTVADKGLGIKRQIQVSGVGLIKVL